MDCGPNSREARSHAHIFGVVLAKARRTQGTIPRDLSIATDRSPERPIFAKPLPVVMGGRICAALVRDDDFQFYHVRFPCRTREKRVFVAQCFFVRPLVCLSPQPSTIASVANIAVTAIKTMIVSRGIVLSLLS